MVYSVGIMEEMDVAIVGFIGALVFIPLIIGFFEWIDKRKK